VIARSLLHTDMGIYFDYEPDPKTNFTYRSYFPQGHNKELSSSEDENALPIAFKRASQAFGYAKDNKLFLNDLL